MSDPTDLVPEPIQTRPMSELLAYFHEHQELLDAMAEFRRMYHIYRNMTERYFASQGLTHLQYAALLALCARGNETPFTVGELAAYFRLTYPACVQLLNRMEERELLTRVEEGNIARCIPTEAGMSLVYSFLMADRAGFPPQINLRADLVRAIVRTSQLEQEFFRARGVDFPLMPFIEYAEPDEPKEPDK